MKNKKIIFAVSAEFHLELKSRAALKGWTMNRYIHQAIRCYMQDEKELINRKVQGS